MMGDLEQRSNLTGDGHGLYALTEAERSRIRCLLDSAATNGRELASRVVADAEHRAAILAKAEADEALARRLRNEEEEGGMKT